MRSRETDRGSWRLVMRREFWVRLRDKGFLISTAITVTVLSLFILGNAVGGGGPTSFRLAVVGEQDRAIGETARDYAASGDVTLTLVDASDRAAAEAQVRNGDVDGAMIDGQLVVKTEPIPLLAGIAREAQRREAIKTQLSALDIPEAEIGDVLQPEIPPVDNLEPVPSKERKVNSSVAIVTLLLLYGQLFGYGVWVASGVVEEKSSRVVEVLLSSIRARQLMAGKVLGIGLLGILQLLLIGVVAAGLALLTGVLNVPGQAFLTVAVTLLWFALGFAFYASLFAAAGALVSRMEELQNAIVPLNLIILGSFFVSIVAADEPTSTLSRAASIVPFSAVFAMPPRIALGAASIPEALVSAGLLVGATALVIPFAGRLYAGAILRIGARVKLRDAWRAAR